MIDYAEKEFGNSFKFYGKKHPKNNIIHHINFKKNDNRIENLYICKNNTEHNKLSKQLEQIGIELYNLGYIIFDKENKEYIIKGDLNE